MRQGYFAVVLVLGIASAALPAVAADNKLKEIQDRGVMRVCFAEANPSSYKDPKLEKWVGFNVDMSELVAQELSVKTEYVDATWGTVIVSLQTGKCDVIMAGLTRTTKRAATVLFVNPYHVNTLSAVVKADSPTRDYAQLNNPQTVVAVASGTSEENYMKSSTSANVRSLVTDKLSSIFFEVAAGRADAAMTDTITVRKFLASQGELRLREVNDKPVLPRGSSWAVAPGEYQFQQFLNVFLETAESNGTKAKVYAKWYSSN